MLKNDPWANIMEQLILDGEELCSHKSWHSCIGRFHIGDIAGLCPCNCYLYVITRYKVLWELMKQKTDPGLKGQERPKGNSKFRCDGLASYRKIGGKAFQGGKSSSIYKGLQIRQLVPRVASSSVFQQRASFVE